MKKNKILRSLVVAITATAFSSQSAFADTLPEADVLSSRGDLKVGCKLFSTYDGYRPSIEPVSKHGGWRDKRVTATGYFHVRKVDGRWWAVDPEGYLFISKGINSIELATKTPYRAHMFLRDAGFNTMGMWSDEETLNTNAQATTPLAYCPRLTTMASYRRGRVPALHLPIWDDAFEDFAMEDARRLSKYANDKNVFGFFSDNELRWLGDGLRVHCKMSDRSDENYRAAISFLSSRGRNANNFTLADEHAYMGLMADRYYSILARAIGRVAPNHMYIGNRCNSAERYVREFMQAAGRHVDLFTMNHYSRWSGRKANIGQMAEWLGKPMVLSEFYAQEPQTGAGTTGGAGFLVDNEKSRGMFYENYVATHSETKNIVGYHWFKYADDGNGHKGIIKENGGTWFTLRNNMRKVHQELYGFMNYLDTREEPDVVLSAEADASYNNNSNEGNSDELRISQNSREIFIRFNVNTSSLNNRIAEKATIRLKSIIASGATAGATDAYRAEFVANDNWNERTINESNKPSGSTDLYEWTFGDDVDIDVTDQVNAALAGDGKISIRIWTTASTFRTPIYGSSEHSFREARPELLIHTRSSSPTTRFVQIRKRNASNFVLNGGSGAVRGQAVTLFGYRDNHVNLTWEEIDRGNGYFSYQKKGTNVSIDGGSNGSRNQAVKLQLTGSNNQNQQWKKISKGNGFFQLQKRNAPDFVLNGGSGGKDRQPVTLWSSSSTSHNLQWSFEYK